MRTIALLTILIFTACSTQAPVRYLELQRCLDASVMVLNDTGGRGTGFYIGDGKIMTAWHVISTVNVMAYVDVNGVNMRTKLIKWNVERDIAIIQILDEHTYNLPIIKISKQAPKLGDALYSVGFHFGQEFLKLVTHGTMTRYDATNKWMIYDAAINPGSSGGPILNSDYELIGINQMTYGSISSYVGISLSLSHSELIKFMLD